MPFRSERAAAAVALLTQSPGGVFLGGSTNPVDLMMLGVAQPDLLARNTVVCTLLDLTEENQL